MPLPRVASAEGPEARAPHPWWVGIVSGMASYIDSAAIVSNGIALVLYQDTIGLTDGEFGWLSGALTFCIAIGAFTGGRLGDAFGRRSVFLVTMAMIAVGSALLVFGSSFPPLLVGVLLMGLGTGADLPVSLATIAEAATGKNRGALLGLSNLLWTVGIIASTLIGALAGDLGRLGGQLLYGHVGLVAIVLLLLRLGLPESPHWLRARDERRRGISTVRAERARLADLFTAPYAKPFCALLVFYCLTNLAANTNGQFGTYVAVHAAGLSVELKSQLNLFLLPVGVVCSLLFMKFVGTRLRMPLFVGGAVLFTVQFAVPATFGFNLATIVTMLLVGAIGSAFAFEGIMKVWTQESFPTMLRSTAQGGIVAAARVLAAVVAIFTPALVAFSPRLTYGVLSAVVGLGFVTGWLVFHRRERSEFDVETEKLTPEQDTVTDRAVPSPRT